MKDFEVRFKINSRKILIQILLVGFGMIIGALIAYFVSDSFSPGEIMKLPSTPINSSPYIDVYPKESNRATKKRQPLLASNTSSLPDLYSTYEKYSNEILSDPEITTKEKRDQIDLLSHEASDLYLKLGNQLLQKSFASLSSLENQKSQMDDFCSGIISRLNTVGLKIDSQVMNKLGTFHDHRDRLIYLTRILENNIVKMKSYLWLNKETYEKSREEYFGKHLTHKKLNLSQKQVQYLNIQLDTFQSIYEEFEEWSLKEKSRWIDWLAQAHVQTRNADIAKKIENDQISKRYQSEFLNFLRMDILCVVYSPNKRSAYLEDITTNARMHFDFNYSSISKSYLNPWANFLQCYQSNNYLTKECFETELIMSGTPLNYFDLVNHKYEKVLYNEFLDIYSKR